MIRKLVLAASAWALVLVGTSAQQEVPVLETPFYPLQVGNTWIYRVGGEKGDQKVVVKVEKLEMVEFRKGDKIEKVPAHRLAITKDDRVKSEFVAVLPDGVYRIAGDPKDGNQPLRFFKLPLKKGEKWEVNATLDGVSLRGHFQANEAEVKVPAATTKPYQTMTVSGTDFQIGSQTMSLEYWFAPNVGIVKQWVKLGSYEVTLELEKFIPGK